MNIHGYVCVHLADNGKPLRLQPTDPKGAMSIWTTKERAGKVAEALRAVGCKIRIERASLQTER
jgi:hypothetical protein